MATRASHKPEFYVEDLTLKKAESAFPLIRATAPDVTLETWLDYAERCCREGGLMGLFGADGMLVGLFSHRIGERLRHGRVLALDDFVSFELSRAAPGKATLIAAAEMLARSNGCTGLEVRIGYRGFADAGSSRAQAWFGLGLAPESVLLVKPLRDSPCEEG